MTDKFFGYWLYLADGTDKYYSLDVCPDWAISARIVSLAFINPIDFDGLSEQTVS